RRGPPAERDVRHDPGDDREGLRPCGARGPCQVARHHRGHADDRRRPAARAGAGAVRDAGRAQGVPAPVDQSGRYPGRCDLTAARAGDEGSGRSGRAAAGCRGEHAGFRDGQRHRVPGEERRRVPGQPEAAGEDDRCGGGRQEDAVRGIARSERRAERGGDRERGDPHAGRRAQCRSAGRDLLQRDAVPIWRPYRQV
ncbi:hypothetical protein LTR94_031315, partial [Friedmanniomyces endolithicus]